MRKITISVNQIILRSTAVIAAALALVMGVNTAQAAANVTVTFSTTSHPLQSTFMGFSYEKAYMTQNLFRANNTALINCFSNVGDSGILRIGGRSVDYTGWNGEQGSGPITTADVDQLAGFMNALPSGWKVIYGINCTNNNWTSAGDESSYVHTALGSRLHSFEIGNETEQYKMTETQFIAVWSGLKAHVISNGPVEGPDEGGGSTSYTTTFADSQSNSPNSYIVLLSQHYYRDTPSHWTGNITGAMTNLLATDPNLPTWLGLVGVAFRDHVSQGFRMDEVGSYSHTGIEGLSDALGGALWSLDFMGTCAKYNCVGVNFHTGSNGPNTPIYDNHTSVYKAGADLYGMTMFSLLPAGDSCNTSITGDTVPFFSAFGVLTPANQVSCILDNKYNNNTITATVHLGSSVSNVHMMTLNVTSGDLYTTNNFVLGGSAINTDGSWNGTFGSTTASSGVLTVTVNSHSALLLSPY
jgi:hypothetical protein